MKKALLSKAIGKSDLVKNAVQRLKDIVVRLDYGCSSAWLKELDSAQIRTKLTQIMGKFSVVISQLYRRRF